MPYFILNIFYQEPGFPLDGTKWGGSGSLRLRTPGTPYVRQGLPDGVIIVIVIVVSSCCSSSSSSSIDIVVIQYQLVGYLEFMC